MGTRENLGKAALAGVVGLGLSAVGQNASAAPKWAKKGDTVEKCLGVSLKGQNDCGAKNGSHGCTGMAKKDKDPNEWVYTPDGLCKKIGGTVWKTEKLKG